MSLVSQGPLSAPLLSNAPLATIGKPIVNLPRETYGKPDDTLHDLYERIAAKIGVGSRARFPLTRLRLTKNADGSFLPNDNTTLYNAGLDDKSTILVKDLGPQIAWRTVFIIEYLGPLLIHPLLYFGRTWFYRTPPARLTFPDTSSLQTLSFGAICLHFLKREYETVFVHRFSNATMPRRNIFKNSAHYWLLAGLNLALFTYSPSDACPTNQPSPPWFVAIAMAMFVIGEIGNFSAHLTLRDLRTKGSTERKIPSTGVFKYVPVTCPNYFFETLAWAGIWMLNKSWSTALFGAIAVGQMAVWARKKEKRYRQEFGNSYSRKRFSMLPGIV